MSLDEAVVRRAVAAALQEDLGDRGDVTTRAVVPAERRLAGHFIARSELVLAGLPVAREVCRSLDTTLAFETAASDGDRVEAGRCIATVRGAARPILEGERTALNFLMRMCGIATLARAAVDEIAGTGAIVLDTRKTAPGLRMLDKYAVAAGGGSNHRMGLFDAAMIKDTHLGTGVSIAEAVRRLLARGVAREAVTAEVRSLQELDQAIAATTFGDIDADDVAVLHLDAEGGGPIIDADLAIDDALLQRAPGAHAGPRQHFLQAISPGLLAGSLAFHLPVRCLDHHHLRRSRRCSGRSRGC